MTDKSTRSATPRSSAQTAPVTITGLKQTGEGKISRNPFVFDSDQAVLRKPDWIRIRIPAGNAVQELKQKLRKGSLFTVCEEASCPNIHECFSKGTATFMILGEICTRRCAFCDVAHGRPLPVDSDEPVNLARSIRDMGLKYVVITSVDRDDLRDGGAAHFVECIEQVRASSPGILIEILTPDFRGKGRMDRALNTLANSPPDVFNHNLETVVELYPQVRPGADYQWSLDLLKKFKQQHPKVATKSGIMLGLGETLKQVHGVMRDLRAHDVDMITIGQYLQPGKFHHPVMRYWTPEEFDQLRVTGEAMGFTHVASGPLVRSSFHADEMAEESGLVGLPTG